MNKKNIELKAIVYLSAEGDIKRITYKEEKQLRYISEYANAHNIKIIRIVRRDIRGNKLMNDQFKGLVKNIASGEADIILVAKAGSIAQSIIEAYQKAGMVAQAGGKLITVKEGVLHMPIKIVI